jgi:hypothetical protein
MPDDETRDDRPRSNVAPIGRVERITLLCPKHGDFDAQRHTLPNGSVVYTRCPRCAARES